MSQRHILEPLTLPLTGSHLIEASAGTGKTFTIALLYVRLVLGQPNAVSRELQTGLLPQNLLVVTFTEAATKELRERIRKRLTQAAEVFAGTVEPDSDNALLFDLARQFDPETYPAQRAKLLLAAEWMDEAAISTIHGWCYQMLQEHAFDSGNLFDQTLITSIKELQLSALRDYFRTQAYPLTGQLAERYYQLYPDPEKLFKKVRGLNGGIDSDALSLSQLLEQFESNFTTELQRLKSAPWAQWQPEVSDLLQIFNKRHKLNGTSKNSMLKVWDKLLQWSETEANFPDGFDKGAGYINQTPGRLKEMMKEPPAEVEHPAFLALEQLRRLERELANLNEPLLRHASDWLNKRVSTLMRKRAELGFDDLLNNLHRALSGPRGEHLAEQIRRQFPAALIDEFQDTDQIQYEIFDRIYRVAENDLQRCFVMIGDPKQAIYRFRGADIYTYLTARDSVPGRIHTLGRNFRSHTQVVEAVNRLFLRADQNPQGAFLFGAGESAKLPYEQMQAKGTSKSFFCQGQAHPALTFWSLDAQADASGTKFKARATVETRNTISELCATQIVELLNSADTGFAPSDDPKKLEPVRPKDIAILVNNRTEADAVRSALSARRIKSVYLSDRNSVLLSKQARELLHWIRAFAEPRRLDLLRAALGTASVGLSHTELERVNSQEIALGETIEQFEAYQLIWQRSGIFATVRSFLSDFDIPARLLAQQNERALTDILHLAELMQTLSMQFDGEHALIRQYEQLLLTADEEGEHLNMRLESDADLVKVVTVHKSKGLEYPLVFLPFGTSLRSELRSKDHVRYHDENNQWITRFNPSLEEQEAADRERLAEDMRKLYVALTRAKFALWVGAPATEKWHLSALGYALGMSQPPDSQLAPALRTLQETGLIALDCEPEPNAHLHTQQTESELGEPLAAHQLLEHNWWIASYSRIQYESPQLIKSHQLSESQELSDIDDASAERRIEEYEASYESQGYELPAQGVHAFIKGATPGDFLHSILEWCCEQGFHHISAQPDQLEQEIARRCETRNRRDYPPELITQWIHSLLTRPFALPDGTRCSLATLNKSKAEMEFWFEVNTLKVDELDRLVCEAIPTTYARPQAKELEFNGMLKGFIDLTFEYDGRYYVLDYKSTFLGNDDSAYTIENMQRKTLEKRYDLQYLIYTLALHRYLKNRLPNYRYDQHIGGALVMYLRGINSETAGVLADRPPQTLIEQMDTLISGVEQ